MRLLIVHSGFEPQAAHHFKKDSMKNVIVAPNSFRHDKNIKIFLAGTIDMGKAELWRDIVLKEANILKFQGCVFLNPRRKYFDIELEQNVQNVDFREQVEWELDGIDAADIIFFYFDPKTISPVTLVELGLVIEKQSREIIICCPDGYFRKGNIQVLAKRYDRFIHDTLCSAIFELKRVVKEIKSCRS